MAQITDNKKKKSSSDVALTSIPVPAYENAKQIISKQIESLKKEMNRTDIEWLNLCHLARQSPAATTETKPALFKDAAELNAVPLSLELESSNDHSLTSQHSDENDEDLNDEGQIEM